MRYVIALFLVVLIGGVCMAYYYPCPPSVPSIPSGLPKFAANAYNMMGPAAHNALKNALNLKEKAHSLLDQAMEQDLDVSEIEDLIERADALVEKAQTMLIANPIPTGNMCREAAEIYENAISDLEALLG